MTWPIESVEYGSYQYLMRHVGRRLGYGGNQDAWTREQREVADAVVQRGVRRFYTPQPLEGETYAHEWSFLRPIRPIVTVANQYAYDLPADFAMLDGPMTFAPDQSVLYQPIELVSIYEVNRRRQETSSTGRPTLVALVAGETPRSYQIHFWLTPDTAYTIWYPSKVSPLDLSDDNPMPFGGNEHAQTILEACLAEAEVERGVKESVHEPRFKERLFASVSHDRKVGSPPTLGRNVDRSDRLDESYTETFHDLDNNIVTYNGVAY